MKYLPFCQIRVHHRFFSDGICPDLAIRPSSASLKTLANHRIEIREKAAGLDFLCPVNEQNAPFIPFQAGFSLVFDLLADRPYFFNYTDLSGLQEANLSVYSNEQTPATASGKYVLSPQTGQEAHPGNPGSTVAQLRLNLGASLAGPPALAPEFKLEFGPRRMTWKYFLIAKNNGQDLSLIDKGSVHTFTKVQLLPNADLSGLPADPARDRVIAQLENRFPERNRYLFESAAPIEFSQQGYKGLQLVKGTLPVLKDLSNPVPEQNGIQFIMK